MNRRFFLTAFTTTSIHNLHRSIYIRPKMSLVDTAFEKLQQKPSGNDNEKKHHLLLDGGTGEELFRRGVPDDRKIWSASAVIHSQYHPILHQVHRSFIDSGCDMITTNSYGITPGVGFTHEEIATYASVAGRIAREAAAAASGENKDGTTKPILVCGSLGPLVESYRPDLIMKHDDGVEAYRIMIEALEPHVDLYLAETMSSVDESCQAVNALSGNTKPIMVSYTLKSDGAIRSGEKVTVAIRRIVKYAENMQIRILAVLFNCSEPEAITSALTQIHGDKKLRELMDEKCVVLGAYANRLTPIPDQWTLDSSSEPQSMRNDLSPSEYFNKFVSTWVNDLNVQIVGGCCGITPEHISYIHNQLKS